MSNLQPPTRVVLAVAVLLATAIVLVTGLAVAQSGVTVEINAVGPETVQVDEVVTVEYTANGSGITDDDVTLVFEHPRGHEVTVSGQSGTNISQDVDIEPFNLDPGPYDVRVEVDGGPTAEVPEAIEVAPVYNPENANFATTTSSAGGIAATYEGVAGDFVTVSVTLNEVDDAYILVGGDRSTDGSQSGAPLDILHVSDSTTFAINTRLVGTDRPSEEVYIPIDGGVTSYAHDLGPDSKPAGAFEGLHFENEEYEQVAETLTEFRKAANSGVQARPLQPGSNIGMVIAGGDSVVVTEEGFPDARFPLDRANIALTQPELRNVTTYRLPTGNADERSFALDPSEIEELEPGDIDGLLGEAQVAGTVARTDRLLIEVNATGLYGAMLDSIDGSSRIESGEPALIEPEGFKRLLDRPEGISLEVVHLNPTRNTAPTAVNLFEAQSDDVSIIVDPTFGENPAEMERFYVLVDTRQLDPFEPAPPDEGEFEVRMSYTAPEGDRYRFGSVTRGTLPDPFNPQLGRLESPPFPYLSPDSSTVIRTTNFTVEDRFVEYNRTTDDEEPVVPNSLGATISGVTNLAPGTDLPVNIIIDVRNDPTKVEITGVDIAADGSFSVTTDLSMLEPGEEVDIEFWAYQKKLDERPLVVADKDNVSGEYEITDLTAESVVTANGTLVEMSGVVTNTGLLPDNKTVELILDNELVANETVELAPGESRVLHFDDALSGLDPGQYPLELRTPDDFEGMLLVVDEADGVFEVTDINATSTVTDGEAGIAFETTVRNTGTINETGTVELLLNGEVVTERTANLLVGQDVSYTFADELAGLGPGNYTLTVRTPDNERTVNVTVEEPEAVLELDGIEVAATVQQGGQLSPTAVVNNTGTIAGEGNVTVSIDGETIAESAVGLSPGENATVAFGETVVDLEPGTYTLRVETPDDTQTVELVVEAQEDDDREGADDEEEDTDDGGDSEGDDDGGPGPVVFGVRVGRPALIGGTALVAGIHVLGYWM